MPKAHAPFRNHTEPTDTVHGSIGDATLGLYLSAFGLLSR